MANPDMINTDVIREKIETHIPGADVVVADMTGNGDHFAVDVKADQFKSVPMLQQHRMIYAALGDDMRQAIHALRIVTSPK